MSVQPPGVEWKDYFGNDIEVGDTVVYGVYTRNGGLSHGVVIELVAKENWQRRFDYTNNTYEDVMRLEPKIKLEVATTKWDSALAQHVPTTKKQTLDTPKRFAIMKKRSNEQD